MSPMRWFKNLFAPTVVHGTVIFHVKWDVTQTGLFKDRTYREFVRSVIEFSTKGSKRQVKVVEENRRGSLERLYRSCDATSEMLRLWCDTPIPFDKLIERVSRYCCKEFRVEQVGVTTYVISIL